MEKIILEAIEREKEILGGYDKVAIKCGVSDTAISNYRSGKYGAGTSKLENKLIIGLKIKLDSWKVAVTNDIERLHYHFNISKQRSLFLGVSEKAGSGKTASINSYSKGKKGVFVIKAREWGARIFLDELMRILGIEREKGYMTIDRKLVLICERFNDRRRDKPQLIIDEADKLKPAALRTLIPLYNECEDVLSVIICGTENLKKEIKRGVNYSRKGFDELDSRFGRVYQTMNGSDKKDVKAICEANGVTEAEKIKEIWNDCPKIKRDIRVGKEIKQISLVVDMRLLKRLIMFS